MHTSRCVLDNGSTGRALRTLALTVIFIADFSALAQAQQPANAPRVVADSLGTTRTMIVVPPQKSRDDSKELVPLFGWTDVAVAAGFGVATIGLFQLDKYVAQRSQAEINQANQFLTNFSKPSELLAWPGGLIIEGGLYAVGRLRHRQRAAEVGWHGAEAIIIATGVTNVLKKLTGRSRPFVSADSNPHDFKFAGGIGNHNRGSFPSGHTTSAFALAAAVASESRTKWPDKWWSAWLIGPALYGGATVVGISRLYHNKHWASDVALGAAIGTFSGIKVVEYAHHHPNNLLDRIMLGTRVVPNAEGKVALAWSFPTP